MRRLLQRILSTISIILSVLLLSGCASQENKDVENVKVESDVAVSEESVAVASLESIGNNMKSFSKIYSDTLYYVESKWDSDYQYYTTFSIHRQPRGADSAEAIVSMEEAGLHTYLVDKEESVYFLYSKGLIEEREYFLRKVTKAGDIIYDVPVSADGRDLEIFRRMANVTMGAVNRNGEICLANADRDLYLFDAEGQLQHMKTVYVDSNVVNNTESVNYNLVNAGKEGIFIYVPQDEGFVLQEIDLSNGSLEEPILVQLDDQDSASQSLSIILNQEMPWEAMEVFDGYDMGVFLSNGDSLWRYDISEAALTKVLNWNDSTVNLAGYMIDGIGVLEDESLYVMAHKNSDDVVYAHIDYKNAADIQEKQTITMAIPSDDETTYEEMEQMISKFNRSSAEYQIELVPYDSLTDIHLDLIRGAGQDIMFLAEMYLLSLADKGVLEDLSPYFEESSIVKESDLIPSIRRAGTVDGKLVCILPQFNVNGFWVEKGTTDKGCWTPEEFIALGEAYPESVLMDTDFFWTFLDTAIEADLDYYIDWQDKKCHFGSTEFIALIERIRKLNLNKTYTFAGEIIMSLGWDGYYDRFFQKEVLMYTCPISSIFEDYMMEINEGIVNGSYAEVAGYPNHDERPYFELMSTMPLGINSASEKKEGAWAFLEFLLSEEYQSKLISFPVRQDCFDKYLAKEKIFTKTLELSDDDREYIRYMVDNAYWSGTSSVTEISRIISEETAPVWEGAKTAEEAAKIIQSRVMLYLNE